MNSTTPCPRCHRNHNLHSSRSCGLDYRCQRPSIKLGKYSIQFDRNKETTEVWGMVVEGTHRWSKVILRINNLRFNISEEQIEKLLLLR
jgi:hypothetical protein